MTGAESWMILFGVLYFRFTLLMHEIEDEDAVTGLGRLPQSADSPA